MVERDCAGKTDVDRHKASEAEKTKLIKDLQDMLDGKGVNASVTQPPIVVPLKTPVRKSRKKQVYKSREDYQAFLEIAETYLKKFNLPYWISMGERYELAEDIARQMCLRVDKGEPVTEPYIRRRVYARSRELLKH